MRFGRFTHIQLRKDGLLTVAKRMSAAIVACSPGLMTIKINEDANRKNATTATDNKTPLSPAPPVTPTTTKVVEAVSVTVRRAGPEPSLWTRLAVNIRQFADDASPLGMFYVSPKTLEDAVRLVETSRMPGDGARTCDLREIAGAERVMKYMMNMSLYDAKRNKLLGPVNHQRDVDEYVKRCVEAAMECRITPGLRYCDFTAVNMPIIHSLFTLPKFSVGNLFAWAPTAWRLPIGAVGDGGRLGVYMAINRVYNFGLDYQGRSGDVQPLKWYHMTASISASVATGYWITEWAKRKLPQLPPPDFSVSTSSGILRALSLGARRTVIPWISTVVGHHLDVHFSRYREYTTLDGAPCLYTRKSQNGLSEYHLLLDADKQPIHSREAGWKAVWFTVGQRCLTALAMIVTYTACTPLVEWLASREARFQALRLVSVGTTRKWGLGSLMTRTSKLARLATACYVGLPMGRTLMGGEWHTVRLDNQDYYFRHGK